MTYSRKVLIVDDNKLNLTLIDVILRRDGYETCLVLDSQTVLSVVESFAPDLILLDIDMPVLSGLEVCQQLKESEKLKDIPVIFVTGNTDDDIIKKAFAVGGHDYVRKPVNQIELLTRMHAVNARVELIEHIKYEEKLKGILEMAGTVCHEFNQPLQVISGSAELLLLESADDAPGRDLAETIVDQALRMGTINSKLMKITRYEKKHYIGNSTIIDLEKTSITGGIK
ncbi:MAG: response regulator [Deltaproteobacteria bacterium]|nr:response regulator [Candidatus Tharpella aukensis]